MELYAWVDEQEDYWDDIATKKIEQLDNITKSHLDWFDKHTTISDILAWKRPVVESKNENVSKQNGVIEVESIRSVNDVSLNRQESISKMNDLLDEESGDFHIAPELRLLFCKKDQPDNITEIPLPTHPLADSTVTDAVHKEPDIQNPGQSDIITDITDDIRRTPELDTETNTQSQKIPTTPKSYDDKDQTNTLCTISPIRHINSDNDDDDDDDEIQLVVPKRRLGGDTVLSPVRKALNQYTSCSPIRTASEHYINGSPNRNSTQLKSPTPTASPARYQSPFMSRLFQLAQSSNSRDSKGSISSTHFITVRPKPSESTNSTTSAKDNNIRMSLLENHPQKRPRELVEEPRMSNIETNSVSNIPAIIAPTIDKTEESEEAEVNYPIPSWSMSPELYVHLKNQENIDPDSIFSAIPPLNLEDIFANPEIYLLK
ncbi:hypothetical protein INT48_007574 [Thamnidium elegans]|uniref:Inner centromere protein ARK-binding domain-containing protein n=1 Tax=Thamnidium elegans TaxID=101142 RepID=A0A8H7SMH8_9FUNG|nr:hypothetical protein INT48_007574 [Thamnidium elegans]